MATDNRLHCCASSSFTNGGGTPQFISEGQRPCVSQLQTPWLTLGSTGNFICHILRPGVTRDEVAIALSEARAFFGIVVLTHDFNDVLNKHERLTADEVKNLAERAKNIVFEAFDGFGYVVWQHP